MLETLLVKILLMKILLISGHTHNWDAGASLVCLHLEEELRLLGHDCTLLHAEDYMPARLPAIARKMAHSEWVRRRAWKLAQEADVVEAAGNIGWRLFTSLRALPATRRPLLVTRLHGLEFKDEQARVEEEIARQIVLPRKYKMVTRHWTNWQEYRTLALSDLVCCYTSREADALIVSRLKAEKQIQIVPLGVDARYFGDRDVRSDVDGVRLLWWGSWIERKGISALPRAFLLACRQQPNLSLTLGGTGKTPEQILPEFAPDVRDRVHVLPFVSRAAHQSVLREHDIFVFPSLSEGFGLALLEAMAAGLPPITTFTGMAHDLLEHGQNALLVPMSAPTALAREIVRLSHDLPLRHAIGSAAQETARALTWAQFGALTAAGYAEALAARSLLLEEKKTVHV